MEALRIANSNTKVIIIKNEKDEEKYYEKLFDDARSTLE